jgi:hypothetical protein
MLGVQDRFIEQGGDVLIEAALPERSGRKTM